MTGVSRCAGHTHVIIWCDFSTFIIRDRGRVFQSRVSYSVVWCSVQVIYTYLMVFRLYFQASGNCDWFLIDLILFTIAQQLTLKLGFAYRLNSIGIAHPISWFVADSCKIHGTHKFWEESGSL